MLQFMGSQRVDTTERLNRLSTVANSGTEVEQNPMVLASHVLSLPFVYGKTSAKG